MSSSLERSQVLGVESWGLASSTFLMGELWRAPDSFLCLLR